MFAGSTGGDSEKISGFSLLPVGGGLGLGPVVLFFGGLGDAVLLGG